MQYHSQASQIFVSAKLLLLFQYQSNHREKKEDFYNFSVYAR